MVDRFEGSALLDGNYGFNLVIEILMVDRQKNVDEVGGWDKFQSRNRDSYG